MGEISLGSGLILAVFVIGYLFIILEHRLGINKAIPALLAGITICGIQFSISPLDQTSNTRFLLEQFADVVQIIIFLFCALAIVEMIYIHGGLQLISKLIRVPSKKGMLWVIGIVTFFLSSILDNLTSTIVMVMLLKKLIAEREERLIFGSAVVIAANAGGAWTPIGDVTTTMLWIEGRISSFSIMQALFIPSLACLVGSLVWFSPALKGKVSFPDAAQEEGLAPHGKLVFIVGMLALVFVPVFKALTGLPPFIGILFSMTVVWLLTEFLHRKSERHQFSMTAVFSRIDMTILLFFLGILIAVDGLEVAGILHTFASFLDNTISSKVVIATVIGLVSAVIDNVPLVAACIGMYDLAQYPIDHYFWQLIAYTAGTGGSVLIIGSAAGVAFMGIEKVDFFWYLRKVAVPALFGYFAGILVYLLF